MPDLSFQVEGAQAVANAAAPTLALKLRIDNAEDRPIHSVMLRCQIQIEAPRRQYDDDEKARLFDLFAEPLRWGQTLRSLLWTHTNVMVPSFTDSASVDLPVPCTFDFTVATTKYFDALEDGEVPLCLLFSGTIFYQGDDGRMLVSQVPWDKEAKYRMPVRVWRDMMDRYHGDTAWLTLQKDMFDRLRDYKTRNGLPTWEDAFGRLLESADKEAATP